MRQAGKSPRGLTPAGARQGPARLEPASLSRVACAAVCRWNPADPPRPGRWSCRRPHPHPPGTGRGRSIAGGRFKSKPGTGGQRGPVPFRCSYLAPNVLGHVRVLRPRPQGRWRCAASNSFVAAIVRGNLPVVTGCRSAAGCGRDARARDLTAQPDRGICERGRRRCRRWSRNGMGRRQGHSNDGCAARHARAHLTGSPRSDHGLAETLRFLPVVSPAIVWR